MSFFGLSLRIALLIIGGSLLLGILFDRIGRPSRQKNDDEER